MKNLKKRQNLPITKAKLYTNLSLNKKPYLKKNKLVMKINKRMDRK